MERQYVDLVAVECISNSLAHIPYDKNKVRLFCAPRSSGITVGDYVISGVNVVNKVVEVADYVNVDSAEFRMILKAYGIDGHDELPRLTARLRYSGFDYKEGGE